MFEDLRTYPFGFVVDYTAPDVAHMLSGGESRPDSVTAKSLGPIAEGVSGAGMTLCGERAYGVLGIVAPEPTAAVCQDCLITCASDGRDVVPDGWTVGERDAYWYGFDRGFEFSAFMHEHHANAFGDEVPMTPWTVEADDARKARYADGMLDGARAFGQTLTLADR